MRNKRKVSKRRFLNLHNSDHFKWLHDDSVCKTRSFIIGKQGTAFFILKVESLAYFFIESEIIYVVDSDSERYKIDAPDFSDLIDMLDGKIFYKVNKDYILNIKFICGCQRVEPDKIQISMSIASSMKIEIDEKEYELFGYRPVTCQ